MHGFFLIGIIKDDNHIDMSSMSSSMKFISYSAKLHSSKPE